MEFAFDFFDEGEVAIKHAGGYWILELIRQISIAAISAVAAGNGAKYGEVSDTGCTHRLVLRLASCSFGDMAGVEGSESWVKNFEG